MRAAIPPLVDGFADSRDIANTFKVPHGPLLYVIETMRGEFARGGFDDHFRERRQIIGGEEVHSVLLSGDAVRMLFATMDRLASMLPGTGSAH